jgi:hypothetical protein
MRSEVSPDEMAQMQEFFNSIRTSGQAPASMRRKSSTSQRSKEARLSDF